VSNRVVGALRRLAPRLVRGPDAPFVLADLEEAWERDLAKGIPRGRAALRYGRNLTASAVAVARARTSTRSAEIAVRTALGASRARIVSQL